MEHELDKLDHFLQVPTGTSHTIIVQHNDPTILNMKLNQYGITLDQFGMVPKNQHAAWKTLMQIVGIDKRYWKDKDLLLPEAEITGLEER